MEKQTSQLRFFGLDPREKEIRNFREQQVLGKTSVEEDEAPYRRTDESSVANLQAIFLHVGWLFLWRHIR